MEEAAEKIKAMGNESFLEEVSFYSILNFITKKSIK